jgi:hypothetical protein
MMKAFGWKRDVAEAMSMKQEARPFKGGSMSHIYSE